uniref:Oligopeptide transporter n=1 Tax=Kalanchoe fedtschenkoi TaxID=63787 RepID=A0A7N0V936_KALFE
MQIAVLPIGKFMASALPKTEYRVFGRRFSLNPGPFNIKEHVIITIFANCGVSPGGGDAYSIGAVTVMKGFYRQRLSFWCSLIMVLTSQLLGYGWAGMLRRYLVDPVQMWWPANVAQVSLFRALHEKDLKSQGLTRMRFFLLTFGASFVYYAFPGYLFKVLSFFSIVCFIWPKSITAQQVGSGYQGLGVGAFTFDWAGISAYQPIPNPPSLSSPSRSTSAPPRATSPISITTSSSRLVAISQEFEQEDDAMRSTNRHRKIHPWRFRGYFV